MTNEEAINYLKISMAIGEDDDSRHHNEVLKFIIKALEQEPCEDCISRQDAIDAVRKAYENDEMLDGYEYRLGELPSAQPEIIRCRECKYAEVADKEDTQDGYICQFHRGSIWFSGSYCSWAERRTDE